MRWIFGVVFAIAVTLVAAVSLEAEVGQGRTYTVNDTGDDPDASPGDGKCATVGGVCTLRAAVMEANASPEADTIEFRIPGAGRRVIVPSKALSPISQPLTLNGLTQPGASAGDLTAGRPPVPGVRIQGSATLAAGLHIIADEVTIRGLEISEFNGKFASGVLVSGDRSLIEAMVLDGNAFGINMQEVEGAMIGGDSAGSGNVVKNTIVDGIHTIKSKDVVIVGNLIEDTREDGVCFIDGSGSIERNVIAGNGNQIAAGNWSGVDLAKGKGVVIRGNFIGTDRTGSVRRGNHFGIKIAAGTSDTVIGGESMAHGNVISGNDGSGIHITPDSTGTRIQNNLIGVDSGLEGDLCNGFPQIDDAGSGTVMVGNVMCTRPPSLK